jgi:hypothetical protein
MAGEASIEGTLVTARKFLKRVKTQKKNEKKN